MEARRARRAQRQYNPAGQVVIGLVVIAMGLLFLLDNLGFLDFRFTLQFWPMLLMVFGVLKIVQTRTAQGMFVGAALILVGALMTLKGLGFLYFSWRTIWPVLLIGLGLSVIFRSSTTRRRIDINADPLAKAADDEVVNITSVMAGYVGRVSTPNFRGGEITAVMGGCELDLRNSSINGDAVLNVFAMFGGITLKVPADWTVVMLGTPLLGGFEEKTVLPQDASKRLIIKGYAIMGGLEVRN
jgi:predicted membrane protein